MCSQVTQELRKVLRSGGHTRGLTGLVYMAKIQFLWRNSKIWGHAPWSPWFLRLWSHQPLFLIDVGKKDSGIVGSYIGYIWLKKWVRVFCTWRIIRVVYWYLHHVTIYYRTQENFGMGKLANLVNYELLILFKFSLPIFTDTPKMHLAYVLMVAYLPIFSSPTSFTCYRHNR